MGWKDHVDVQTAALIATVAAGVSCLMILQQITTPKGGTHAPKPRRSPVTPHHTSPVSPSPTLSRSHRPERQPQRSQVQSLPHTRSHTKSTPVHTNLMPDPSAQQQHQPSNRTLNSARHVSSLARVSEPGATYHRPTPMTILSARHRARAKPFDATTTAASTHTLAQSASARSTVPVQHSKSSHTPSDPANTTTMTGNKDTNKDEDMFAGAAVPSSRHNDSSLAPQPHGPSLHAHLHTRSMHKNDKRQSNSSSTGTHDVTDSHSRVEDRPQSQPQTQHRRRRGSRSPQDRRNELHRRQDDRHTSQGTKRRVSPREDVTTTAAIHLGLSPNLTSSAATAGGANPHSPSPSSTDKSPSPQPYAGVTHGGYYAVAMSATQTRQPTHTHTRAHRRQGDRTTLSNRSAETFVTKDILPNITQPNKTTSTAHRAFASAATTNAATTTTSSTATNQHTSTRADMESVAHATDAKENTLKKETVYASETNDVTARMRITVPLTVSSLHRHRQADEYNNTRAACGAASSHSNSHTAKHAFLLESIQTGPISPTDDCMDDTWHEEERQRRRHEEQQGHHTQPLTHQTYAATCRSKATRDDMTMSVEHTLPRRCCTNEMYLRGTTPTQESPPPAKAEEATATSSHVRRRGRTATADASAAETASASSTRPEMTADKRTAPPMVAPTDTTHPTHVAQIEPRSYNHTIGGTHPTKAITCNDAGQATGYVNEAADDSERANVVDPTPPVSSMLQAMSPITCASSPAQDRTPWATLFPDTTPTHRNFLTFSTTSPSVPRHGPTDDSNHERQPSNDVNQCAVYPPVRNAHENTTLHHDTQNNTITTTAAHGKDDNNNNTPNNNIYIDDDYNVAHDDDSDTSRGMRLAQPRRLTDICAASHEASLSPVALTRRIHVQCRNHTRQAAAALSHSPISSLMLTQTSLSSSAARRRRRTVLATLPSDVDSADEDKEEKDTYNEACCARAKAEDDAEPVLNSHAKTARRGSACAPTHRLGEVNVVSSAVDQPIETMLFATEQASLTTSMYNDTGLSSIKSANVLPSDLSCGMSKRVTARTHPAMKENINVIYTSRRAADDCTKYNQCSDEPFHDDRNIDCVRKEAEHTGVTDAQQEQLRETDTVASVPALLSSLMRLETSGQMAALLQQPGVAALASDLRQLTTMARELQNAYSSNRKEQTAIMHKSA